MVEAITKNSNFNAMQRMQDDPSKRRDIRVAEQSEVPAKRDSVTFTSETSVSVVYSRNQVMSVGSPADLNQELRDYVVNILKEQGVAVKFAIDSDTEVDLNAMTPEEAQELISEDGYFGVKKTSDRIAEFAISAAGNDVSRLDTIKSAVMEGFKSAEEAFGGTLADISYDTLDAVMEKLDRWAAGEYQPGQDSNE